MARATWLLGATSLVSASLALWLYLDNRALRAALDTPAAAPATAAPAPALPEPSAESETQSRMERRARRTEELAAMFGRLDGESDADYRARILPMITAGLMV